MVPGLPFLLAACTAPVLDAPAGGPEPTHGEVESVPAGGTEFADALFALDEIHDVEIELSDQAIAALDAEPTEFVEAAVTVDGIRVEGVGVRLKGRLGSFRTLDGKAAFKVDFNRFVDGLTLHGLKALTLNNMVNDYSFVHEAICYDLYPRVGVPAPRVGYAWVTVNGEAYGLYANVETPDDRWLERVYERPDGNLYEADYILYPDGSYTLIDFTVDTDSFFELDEGEDVGHADIHAVTEAVESTWGTDEFYEAVGAVVDWEAFFRYWAVELWVGQWDGYDYNRNNYRVYFDPADGGLAEILPWGHDWAFTAYRDWSDPLSVLASGCMADAACMEAFRTVLAEVLPVLDDADVPGQVAAISELIDAAVRDDPRREVGYDTVLAYQQVVVEWAEARSAEIEAAFGLDEEAGR